MESIYKFSEIEMLSFALIFLRSVSFVVTMPVIGTNNLAIQVKVLFALVLTFILMPIVGLNALDAGITDGVAVILAAKEVFVGLTMGFLSRMFFMALAMAGQIMSVSLGLSSAQLFNPAFDENSSAIDQFFLILATLFFFGINGHHLLISALVHGYKLVPISQTGLNFGVGMELGELAQVVTKMAIGFSAPIMVTILFTNFAMGVVGRAVPQINILITSLPVNTLTGLLVLFLSLPLTVLGMENLLGETMNFIFGVLKTF